jgi:hypothetical protein
MKRVKVAVLLLSASGASLACDATGAFGFEFGKPVPKEANGPMIGGSGMGCVDGVVPAPASFFDHYAYCANRDRKFVYAIEASRVYADGRVLDADKPDAEEMYAKARAAIADIKAEWEKKFGFVYEKVYEHGLHWEARTPTVSSTIMVMGPRVVVDCTNQALQSKAMGIAIKSL